MRRKNLRLEALLKSQAENTRKLISKISMMITLQRAESTLKKEAAEVISIPQKIE